MSVIIELIGVTIIGILFHKQIEVEGRIARVEGKIDVVIDRLG